MMAAGGMGMHMGGGGMASLETMVMLAYNNYIGSVIKDYVEDETARLIITTTGLAMFISMIKIFPSIFKRTAGLSSDWTFYTFRKLKRLLKRNVGIKHETKYGRIPWINDENKPNAMYDSVSWYLRSNLLEIKNREKNPSLDYFCAVEALRTVKDEELKNKDDGFGDLLNKSPPVGRKIEFRFRGAYDMTAKFTTEQVSVGNNRQRTNRIIEITAEVPLSHSHSSPNKKGGEGHDEIDVIGLFLAEAWCQKKEFDQNTRWVQKKYINDESGKWIEIKNTNHRTLENIILKEAQKRQIEKIVTEFPQRKMWYREKSIPHKFTIMMKGPPGTGKTTLVHAVSRDMQRHIYCLNLAIVRNDAQLIELYQKIPLEKSVIVIEDIDASTDETLNPKEKLRRMKLRQVHRSKKVGMMYRTRMDELEAEVNCDDYGINECEDEEMNAEDRILASKRKLKGTGITLQCLLDIMDGEFNDDERVMFTSSNYWELLDERLTRQGRVDYQVELTECDFYQFSRMYEIYYDRKMSEKSLDTIRAAFRENGFDEAVCSTNITPSKYSRALIDFYETEDCEEKVVEWICSCLSERSEKEEEQQNSPTHKAA